MSPRRLVLVASAATVALIAPFACTNDEVHPFSAWTYDPVRDCLETPAVIDVLEGPDDGPCIQLRCWESPEGEYYVTDTACSGPIDYQDETNAKMGVCVQALRVYSRDGHGLCPADMDGGLGGGFVTSS